MRRLSAVTLTTILGGIVVALPAFGAPASTRVDAVYQLPCSGSSCDDDAELGDGDAAAGDIQVDVAASTTVGSPGLEWIRLYARLGASGSWTCVQQWAANGATAITRSYSWDTRYWPDPDASSYDCPASLPDDVLRSSGGRTRNGAYDLRAVARERVSGSTQQSSIFVVRVNNRPTTPAWLADPSTFRSRDGHPSVELRWRVNPEPDIVEYYIVRRGPSQSDTVLYRVRASNPGADGCATANGITCWDNFSGSGYSGSYEYELFAYRSSPVAGETQCAGGSNCIASSPSEAQSVNVNEPSPSPSPSDRPTSGGGGGGGGSDGGGGGGDGRGGGGASPRTGRSPSVVYSSNEDDSEFFEGSYDGTLPYDSRTGFGSLPGDDVEGDDSGGFDTGEQPLASAPDTGSISAGLGDRRIMTSIAAGLLMVLVAMHLVRLMFDR